MIVDNMICFYSIFILTISIRFILLITIFNRVVVVNSFYPTTINSRKIIHGLQNKGKLFDTIIVENDQTYNKHNMIIDLMKQNNNNIMFQSLAGPFLIQSEIRNNNQNDTNKDVYQIQYTFIPLESIDDTNHDANTEYITSTASAICAWNSLQETYRVPNESTASTTSEGTTIPTTVLLASWIPSLFLFKIEESVENKNQHRNELIKVVSRILIQHTLWLWYNNNTNRQLQELNQISKHDNNNNNNNNNINNVTIQFLNEKSFQLQLPLSNLFCNINRNNDIYTTFVRSLFNTLSKDTSTSELVEMVGIIHNKENNNNIDTLKYEHSVVGVVPRTFVHQYNLLHRGIGVIVTKNEPILFGTIIQQQQPDIYCHQRTSTKRIFPSLYDMFIGGVSLVDEVSYNTVLREVSEELGILTTPSKISSQPLFQCIICTTYNRCIVDVYGYTMNSNSDIIQWQEDEVAWGAFVPYSIVEAAANLSIQRLQQENKWPGRYNLDMITSQSTINDGSLVDDDTSIGDEWKHWDFVPDGLLVWESWLHFLKNKKV